jgi:hypothetical protein
MGWVYLVHLIPFYPPVPVNGQQAKHYRGWSRDLPARLETHALGGPDAARLLQVQVQAGGTWQLVAVERGTRDREIQLKYHGASRRCPLCTATAGPAGGGGWRYVLHLEPRRGQACQERPAVHHAGFTAGTAELLGATARGGLTSGRALGAPRPEGGTWRLVTATFGSPAAPPDGDAAELCPVCSPPRTQPRPAELLAAIARGEIADRFHPDLLWTARWHTEYGQPVTTATRVGGRLGRNVTARMAALVGGGLAGPARSCLPDGSIPYELTAEGTAALSAAGWRADGIPVNKNGQVSRSRTTDQAKAHAGVMTAAELAAHTALRRLDHPRRPERLRGALPDADEWAVIPAGPAAVKELARR